jgi:hypothetical protein
VNRERTPAAAAASYATLVVGFTLVVLAGVMLEAGEQARALYLTSLFAICCSPVLLVRRLNGPHVLLMVMLPLYFIYYGLGDFVDLWSTSIGGPRQALLTPGETAILTGAALLVLGFELARRSCSTAGRRVQTADWPPHTAAVLGVVLCVIGLVATWYWQVVVFRYAFGEWRLGDYLAMAVTAGRMLLSLGLFMLSYSCVRSRSAWLAAAMACCLLVELYVGFVGDSKEIAVQGAAILLTTKLLVDGRVPRTWLLAAATVLVFVFPAFQIYRQDVLGTGVGRDEAAHDFRQNLGKTLSALDLGHGEGDFGLRSFANRTSLKENMEMVVARAGKDVPWQGGHTLALFFNGFVPRLLWPDKPDSSTGQLFNRQFHISDFDGVYISTTFIGDFYWNFGWVGLFFGMLLFGGLLGVVGAACDLSRNLSLTRLLVLGVTAYTLCLRFEDGFALEATVWVRLLIGIALFHQVFARRPNAASTWGEAPIRRSAAARVPANLMR